MQARKKHVFTWSRQLLFVIAAFVCVAFLFAYLSNGKRAVVQPPAQLSTATPPDNREAPVQETLPAAIPEANATINEATTDSLQFYNLLQEPLQDDYSPEDEPEEQVAYSVQSGLIRNEVNARSLKALLIFDGFSHIRIDSVSWNNQQWHRLTIENVRSRSRMNAVRDFLGNHDLESQYSRTK